MFSPLANTVHHLLDESSNTSSIDDFSPFALFLLREAKIVVDGHLSIGRHGKLGKQQVLINGNKVSAEIRK
jgi:hypothetical protein